MSTSVKGRFQSVKKHFKSTQDYIRNLVGSDEADELHEIRDEILNSRGSNPKEKAQEIAEREPKFDDYTDVAGALENAGIKELKNAEEIESRIEEELGKFKEPLNDIEVEEAGNQAVDGQSEIISEAEGILEMAEREEEELLRPVEDAKGFFQSVKKIADWDAKNLVGKDQLKKKMDEADRFERRIKDLKQKINSNEAELKENN